MEFAKGYAQRIGLNKQTYLPRLEENVKREKYLPSGAIMKTEIFFDTDDK